MMQPNIIDTTRVAFLKIVNNDKQAIVNALNKNAFSTSISATKDEIVKKSLQAMQISNKFKDDLVGLMTKYKGDFMKASGMKNFAAQPYNGGMVTGVTGLDMTTDINSFDVQNQIFRKAPIFFTPTAPRETIIYTNADGTGGAITDIITSGIQMWSKQQQDAALQHNADVALQIEQARLKTLQAQAQADQAKAGSASAIVKSYTTPIIIVGILAIGGMGAYFYFKKKKF